MQRLPILWHLSGPSCSGKAEVGISGHALLLMPLSGMRGVHPGSLIINRAEKVTVHASLALQGRALDGLGRPMDAQGPIPAGVPYPLYAEPLNPLRKNGSMSLYL